MKRLLTALIVLTPALALAQGDLSTPREVFSGSIPAGSSLRIRGMKGNITVNETSGSTAKVTAVRGKGTRSVEGVTFEVKRDGSSVTVCSIYPQTRQCDEEGYESRSSRGRDELGSVNFMVELPRGVKLVAGTGNGEVRVRNAGADVDASSGNGEISVLGANGRVNASTGNGDVEVSEARGRVEASSGNGEIRIGTTTGPVSASTGNGRIEVKMNSLEAPGDMEFSTGNGSIELSMPANLSADIVAHVPMSRFESDFAMQLAGRFSGQKIEGKIGQGGRRIKMSTGNGHVSLRKN